MHYTKNARAVHIDDVPDVDGGTLRTKCFEACHAGGRISAFCAFGDHVLAVVSDDSSGRIGLVRARVPDDRGMPALSLDLPQAQAFERALMEQAHIRFDGHPWPKPLRLHGEHPFFRVDGPGVHEVAVGPVHAGIIEPGHFRFQCHGEAVLHLEIQLGYQHRGAEALLLDSKPARRQVIAESIAGDTAVGHALAYAMAIESLSEVEPPLEAHAVRGIALELERLANHVGDLGALCNDIGYLPGASWFGRLRGEMLNLLMEISGNRFGRGLVTVGGVRFGIPAEKRKSFLARLRVAERDLEDTARAMFDAAAVMSRFERTGVLTREVATALGVVGPAARASGCDRDIRRDHAFGIFRYAYVPISLAPDGDVMARALVRWLETQRSLTFVREQLGELAAEGPSRVDAHAMRPSSIAVAMVEGWRGEIAHVAVTSASGELAAYQIVDPSFHNWFGLAIAMRDNQISDFPLCNKSFNLSYAGHDL